MRKWLALSAALFIAGPPCLAQAPNVRAVIFPPRPPAATAAASTTWNPADVGANITLSNGNLTATPVQPPFTAAYGARSIANQASGKYYWEVHIDTFSSGGIELGIAIASWNEASSMINTANGAVINNSGLLGYNSINIASGPTFLVNDVVGVAVDLGNSKIWFRVNSGSWNGSGTDNPATNTGGLSIAGFGTAYACAFPSGANSQAITARFNSASWGFAAPSGFGQL